MADGQKKNNTQKNKRSKVTVKNTNRYKEITAVVLAAVGVFLFFALIGKAGVLGRLFKGLLYGLFGELATIVLLALLFAIAWCILRGTADRVFSLRKSILFGSLLLVISSLVHTCAFHIDIYNGLGFMGTISKLWTQKEGGLVGGGISLLLQKLVERPGTLVILITALVVLAMVLFSLSVVRLAKWFARRGKKVSS
ncbi:MAG: DNA translocase FtsK 4TM domain-containing protein, partial [Clostridia bacterium]|nr:DNA translocase FtsK 4TM domain-containing protein [Clostridia bacterium]